MKIIKAREASQNLVFCKETGQMHQNWKVGETNLFEK